MLKTIISMLVVLSLVLSFAALGHCDTAIQKLGRGASNIMASPYEIYLQSSRMHKTEGPVKAIALGMPQGIAMMLVRAVVGVYEVSTFLIPIPKAYGPVLKEEPEVIQDALKW
jgi:putative exosortase-associated protein (TIGR04073 family)